MNTSMIIYALCSQMSGDCIVTFGDQFSSYKDLDGLSGKEAIPFIKDAAKNEWAPPPNLGITLRKLLDLSKQNPSYIWTVNN